AHSLKGSARSVNMKDIVSLCQAFESLFSAINKGEIGLNDQIFDLTHAVTDILNDILNNETGRIIPVSALVKRLNLVRIPGVAVEEAKPEPVINHEPEADITVENEDEPEEYSKVIPAEVTKTVRIPVNKLDTLFLQTEEMLVIKLITEQRIKELKEI